MRKNIKGEKENKRSFNAYQYANDFEKLSLDIVKIIDKSSFDESNIEYSDTTQQTRDYGVDAYLVLNIHGKRSTYTIEAKLRTSDSLSLRATVRPSTLWLSEAVRLSVSFIRWVKV